MDLSKFEISDSKLEHNNWRFPNTIKTRPLRDLEDEEFLINHKVCVYPWLAPSDDLGAKFATQIDRSYDDSTVRLKLLYNAVVGSAISANLQDTSKLPVRPDVLQQAKQNGWISDEYEHLWRRDGGGSAALCSHRILTFLLQTPRDGKSFCSLSLVNREINHVGGMFITDDHYSLETLLSLQPYLNKHPKVPRDFAILPFNILVHHIEETVTYVQRLSRELQSTEKRITEGSISLDDNGDFKLLNRLNLEHLRLQRRSNFELELAGNLLKYMAEYEKMWQSLWEGGTSYIEEMREKIEQQTRYAEQVKLDLDVIPRRIKNQQKTIFNFIAQRDNAINIELAQSSRKIAEESRRDNLLNIEIAKATAQVAEETRQDSAAMKTIAVLTLTFLPGTAVASFFGMNGMFEWRPAKGQQIASPYLWVFWVVTIPVTIIVYIAWFWWFRYTQKQYTKRHEEGIGDIEKKLKSAVRSATGTW